MYIMDLIREMQRSWLRHYGTNRKDAVWNPEEFIGFFQLT
jgi:hypothetical protein